MNTDYCCLDASAFSLGFASSHGGALILEKSENVLSDFVNPITPCIVTEPRTKEGRAFFEYLKSSGCVSADGILDSPSLAPAAAEYALNKKFNILLGVNIISRENNHIKIYTNSGLQNVFCKNVICRQAVKTDFKMLNCLVSGVDYNTLSAFENIGGKIKRNFEKDEFILSLPFVSGCRLNEARIDFVNRIRACFGTDVLIDAFAADFEYGRVSGGIIEEFEAGVNYDLL